MLLVQDNRNIVLLQQVGNLPGFTGTHQHHVQSKLLGKIDRYQHLLYLIGMYKQFLLFFKESFQRLVFQVNFLMAGFLLVRACIG